MANRYHTVYRVINKVNNKIYVGVHSTNNLNDNYFGSGKLILMAIKKYGIENFKKEYIFIFDNKEKAYDAEADIVNEQFVSRADTYNMRRGGIGGGGDFVSHETRQQIATEKKVRYRKKYFASPTYCECCESILPYEKRRNIFCDHSCRAKVINKQRKRKPKTKRKTLCEKYMNNPKSCKQCNKELPYNKRTNTFCDRSCKAKYTNSHRYKK